MLRNNSRFFFLHQEHILMRNQTLAGLKLPDLSEAAEQERGEIQLN